MLPDTGNMDDLILDFNESEATKTQTFRLTKSMDSLGGRIDGVEALAQHIYLLLNTEADQYIIYPYTYGVETLDLIGKPSYYVAAVIPERIKEALQDDPRILSVYDFEFEEDKNKLHVKFLVDTIYGEVEEGMVVSY